ncbi:hypothetical protein EIY71_18095 [Pseudomonas sp. CH235]|nr:hypothetical protein EIY71_18095 [Pseudomonas sp. CH235]
MAWAASGINRQMVSHVLKNGRIRQGSWCVSAQLYNSFFVTSEAVGRFNRVPTEPNKRQKDAIVGQKSGAIRL